MKAINRSMIYLIPSFFLFGGIPMSLAQDYLELSIEELLQVPVKGSTLREESLQNVPAAVTVFTRAQLNSLGFDYLHELLNIVPGYQSSRGADNPLNFTYSSRARRNGGSAREILLVVDGRDISDARAGGGDATFKNFPLSIIEKIEIIRGPGSAIYGSNAFMGVINITTRQNTKKLSLSAGANNSYQTGVAWALQGEKWQAKINGTFSDTDGHDYIVPSTTTGSPYKTQDPHQLMNLDASISFGSWRLSVLQHKAQAEDFYEVETTQNDFNRFEESLSSFNIEKRWQAGENLKSSLLLSYVNTSQLLWTEVLPAGSLMAISNPVSSEAFYGHGILKGRRLSLLQTNDWTIDQASSMQFGINLQKNEEVTAKAYSNFDLSELVNNQYPITYYGDFSNYDFIGSEDLQNNIGIYTQYLRDISDSLHLTLGVRFDEYEHIGNHFSPRLGLVKNLTENQSIKVLYGEAFRAPSLSEIGLTNNPFLVGNLDIHYETINTWDLIWMGNWKNTSISLGGFFNEYKSPIIIGTVGNTRAYTNGDSHSTHGVELEWLQQLNDQWQLRTTYTDFMSLPERAFREADKLGSFVVQYTEEKWSWNLAAVYHSAILTVDRLGQYYKLDSFWLMNSKLRYQLNAQCNIQLQTKNLLDKDYATAQGNNLPQGIPNPGREWSIGVNWNY